MSDFQFASWNVRGLNKFVKLKQVMTRIKQFKANVVFLQETHFTPNDVIMPRSHQTQPKQWKRASWFWLAAWAAPAFKPGCDSRSI